MRPAAAEWIGCAALLVTGLEGTPHAGAFEFIVQVTDNRVPELWPFPVRRTLLGRTVTGRLSVCPQPHPRALLLVGVSPGDDGFFGQVPALGALDGPEFALAFGARGAHRGECVIARDVDDFGRARVQVHAPHGHRSDADAVFDRDRFQHAPRERR